MNKEEALRLISDLLDLAEKVSGTDPGSHLFQKWEFRLHHDIKRIFNPESDFIALLDEICFSEWFDGADEEWARNNQKNINAAFVLLEEAKREVESWPDAGLSCQPVPPPTRSEDQMEILARLRNLDENLERGYHQVLEDIKSIHRISYKGSANELREVLIGVLNCLAPKEDVKKTNWYKLARTQAKSEEERKRGPTKAEQVRFVMERLNKGSKEIDTAKNAVQKVEDSLECLTRSLYSRASDASHRNKDKKEIIQTMKYLDAVLLELLPGSL